MSTETETANVGKELLNTTPKKLVAGAVGGFVGSLLMGALMQTMNPGTLQMGIPAMYGVEGPSSLAGWAFHQWHGVFLGLVYVLGVENVGALREKARTLGGAVGLGVGYGIATTLLPVFVMPVWLSAMGFAGAPPFPNFAIPATLMSAMTHIIYAVPLALVYYYVSRE
ncbi:MAG: histidine kinase [Halobacteriales archaeon]|nr:histidine kinase [Halobacteriales archaeon]